MTLNFLGRDENNTESSEISRIIPGIHTRTVTKCCPHCIKQVMLVSCPNVLQGSKRQDFEYFLHSYLLMEWIL